MQEKVIRLDSARGRSSDADYARLRQELARAVARVSPPRLSDRRDDIVQAGMIKVMKAVERGASRFNATYLKRVAYTAMVDEVRRLKGDREVPLDRDGAPEPRDPRAPSPERGARSRQIGEAIQACIGRITDERKRAVTLYLLGHSAPEIGRLLSWGTKRAENFIYRGMAQLRDCLKRKGFEP